MMVSGHAFAAVRLTDGHEWIDTDTIGGWPEDSSARAVNIDNRIPAWAKANPVVRVVAVQISEVEG